jgi:hypothetical protein
MKQNSLDVGFSQMPNGHDDTSARHSDVWRGDHPRLEEQRRCVLLTPFFFLSFSMFCSEYRPRYSGVIQGKETSMAAA